MLYMIMIIDHYFTRYGDKVPAANHSKAFAVIWVLIGLVVYGILSGSITTAFTTIIYQSSTKLYGAKVSNRWAYPGGGLGGLLPPPLVRK